MHKTRNDGSGAAGVCVAVSGGVFWGTIIHFFNSQIAAATGTRHLETLSELDSLGHQLALEIQDITDSAIQAAQSVPSHQSFAAVVEVVRQQYLGIYRSLIRKLELLADHTYEKQADSIARYFPTQTIDLIVDAARPITEDFGQVLLALQGLVPRLIDRAKNFGEPAFKKLADAAKRKLFRSFLLPKLGKQHITQIVFGSDPQQAINRIIQQTRLADPMVIANKVIQGMSQGQTRLEIAKQLRPIVQQNRAAAMRVVRTEGARVANTSNFQSFEQMGDLIAGYQIHAVLDEQTRPAHRLRNGRIYYKRPKPGQNGIDELPHPPIEADGTVSFNCRCWVSPVFANVPKNIPALDLANAQGRVIPDPLIYDSWFTQASEPLKRKAVGSKRYAAVKAVAGRSPDYYDFVDPDSGELLSVDELQNESNSERFERRNRLARLFSQHRGQKISAILTGHA